MTNREKNKSQLIIYQTEAGETKIDVRFQDETVWLSQQLMAELFQTTVPNINMHIKNIFDEGELSKNATIKDFLIVQNKMHWAITGKTAAEIIHKRADSKKSNMGLTNWRRVKIRKDDVEIAKNYLDEKELLALNNLVEQYLVFAEGQAMRRIPMYMKNWISKLDNFMQLNEREILTHAGKISHQIAMETAEKEYEKYSKKRQIAYDKKENTFDVLVSKTKKIENKKEEIRNT